MDSATENVHKNDRRNKEFGKLVAALEVALARLSAGQLRPQVRRRDAEERTKQVSAQETRSEPETQERGQVCPSLWRLRMRSSSTRSTST